ncbi:hypothetical protein BH11PSE9_BH11PSE9_33830 [soil metagenome]
MSTDQRNVYFAWVKSPRRGAAPMENRKCAPASEQTAAAPSEVDHYAIDTQLHFFSGNRPPRLLALRENGEKGENAERGEKGDYWRECDRATQTERVCAKPSRYGDWTIDEIYCGDLAKPLFEMGQFIGNRDDAIKWLGTDDGRAWLAGAENFFLMRYVNPRAFVEAADVAETTCEDETDDRDISGACRFPLDRWGSQYRKFVNQRDSAAGSLLPDCWEKQVKLPDVPVDDTEGCRQIAAAVKQRDERRDEIFEEATDIMAVYRVVSVKRNPSAPAAPATANMALIEALINSLRGPLFKLKDKYERGRPYCCCQPSVPPMITPTQDLFPTHPAYPAGHATFAHAAALVWGALFPELKERMIACAARVAENRVIAGLHYPSDNVAGVHLAEQAVAQLLASPDFTQLMTAAQAEWC